MGTKTLAADGVESFQLSGVISTRIFVHKPNRVGASSSTSLLPREVGPMNRQQYGPLNGIQD